MRAALGTLAAAFALLATAAGASGSSGPAHARVLGLVPHAGAHVASTRRVLAASAGDLVYHGGPVMHANTTYAIYWVPSGFSVDAGYESLIDRYFTDVAAASGTTTNVYSVATQYYDTTGGVDYGSSFGGSTVDTTPFPASGCSVAAVCLTDGQLQAEIQSVLTTNGWHGGSSAMFFLMTPDGVASCVDGSNTECSTNVYCAYHYSFVDANGEDVIYANEPYDATIRNCNSGVSPNHDDADATINTISHEHIEAITDPFGNAWWANTSSRGEIGDLCGWNFGAPLLGAPNANQLINGHDYWLQMEYSNAGSTCRQSSVELPPANASLPVVSGTAAANQLLSSSAGTWTGDPTGYSYQWQRCAADGSGCAAIAGATSSTYRLTSADGGSTIRAAVSATNGTGTSAPAASAPTELVVSLPATTYPPLVTRSAAVGGTVFTTTGTWNTPISRFAYGWERCDAAGGSCAAIRGATGETYRVVATDAGHTLEASVTATNAAGSVTVSSAPTSVVVAARLAKLDAPRIAGKAKAGRRLVAVTRGRSLSTASLRYHWLRCNARGTHCRAIRHAGNGSYVLRRADVRHRLRVRVTSGRARATSKPTRRVAR